MADYEWARAFAEVAHELTRLDNQNEVLCTIAASATAVADCPWAAVAMVQESGTPTIAATSEPEMAARIGEIQASGGGGPTWETMRSKRSIDVPDLSAETRWPDHVRELLDNTPVRSILTFCLQLDDEPLGALTLYGDRPNAFPTEIRTGAEVYAEHATLALDRARAGARAANLEIALRTSRQIGIALGILVERHKLTADQAWDMLRAASQHYNHKVRDLADHLVLTGELAMPSNEQGEMRGLVPS